MVATEGVPLLHVPPPPSVSKLVCPVHNTPLPVIDVGFGLTVNVNEEAQPVGKVYDIFTRPAVIPETSPVDPAVAVPGEPLLHTPPGVMSVNVVEAPAHTPDKPAIAAGAGLMLTP